MEHLSHNEGETRKIAEKIAKKSLAGQVFALHGDLGSGKTTFTRNFVKSFGVNKEVTSPTFVITKSYLLKDNDKGINEIFHLDCYRLSDEHDAESIGLGELLDRRDVLVIIEWPEKIAMILPKERTRHIYFEYIDENRRKISF